MEIGDARRIPSHRLRQFHLLPVGRGRHHGHALEQPPEEGRIDIADPRSDFLHRVSGPFQPAPRFLDAQALHIVHRAEARTGCVEEDALVNYRLANICVRC